MKRNCRLVILFVLSLFCLALVFCSCNKSDLTSLPQKDTSGKIDLSEVHICFDEKNDLKQVKRAVNDLKSDLESAGSKVTLSEELSSTQTNILVGTMGYSRILDELLYKDSIDAYEIENDYEAFSMSVYNGVKDSPETLIIAGSDMRGTIYGIYDLSSQIGVSPWHWWSDVPVQGKLLLDKTSVTKVEMPSVKYRGIFINDEENLEEWSKQFKSMKNPGSPNPYVYEQVFELLLRLKANFLWPGMHACSDAFNAYVNYDTGIAYNAELADEYGIIMGASHCEMMLCNNETEWVPWCEKNVGKYNLIKLNNDWKASYDYTVNPEAMNAYWEDRVAANYKFENVYTIGLRGVHDSGINCANLSNTSYESKASVVKKAVEAQLEILYKYEKKYKEETGINKHFATIYCPYKEAAEYYKYDLSLPQDCIIVFCDDNYGYVRQNPTQVEKDTYDDFGVYYHVSYWGRPRSYLWIDTTPVSLIYEEMDKAYDNGSDGLWVVNVGDIKPAEISIDFFLSLAWNEEAYNKNNLRDYLAEFASKNYSLEQDSAKELADAMTDFYQLAYAYKPDIQGYGEGVNFSVSSGGDEGEEVLERYGAIYEVVKGVYDGLDEEFKDSYFQVFLYNVKSAFNMTQRTVYTAKNNFYSSVGAYASAHKYADLANDAQETILSDVKTFDTISDGKWKNMVNPYKSNQPQISRPEPLKYPEKEVGVGAVAENKKTTLTFDEILNNELFFDVFTKGDSVCEYSVSAPDYVSFKELNGQTHTGNYVSSVSTENRYFVSVDFSKIPAGTDSAELIVSDDYFEIKFDLIFVKAEVDPEAEKEAGRVGHYESLGYVCIEAENYVDKKDATYNGANLEWVEIPDLGISGNCMKVVSSDLGFQRFEESEIENAPYLEYKVYFTTTGTFNGVFYRIPTLNEGNTDEGVRKTCRTAFSIDGNVTLLRGNSIADDSSSSAWSNGVRYNVERFAFTTTVGSKGWHTIRIYMVDKDIAFDKIILYDATREFIPLRLGEKESFNTVTK